jgi:hypothetical protein
MKNKTLAIFGIGTYLLSVYASTTNADGASAVPTFIVMFSGGASILFTILATIRLWKMSKFVSTLFATTSVIFFGLEVMQVLNTPAYGSSIVIFLSIVKVISLLTFFWVVWLLWRTKHYIN